MFVRISSKREVTLPARVLEALGVEPGDQLELQESPDGFLLRPRRVDVTRLAPLRGKLRRGHGTVDIARIREQADDPTLRD